MQKTRPLSPMEKQFADEFTKTNNGTLSAERVFGGVLKNTKKNMYSKSRQLLDSTRIKKYLMDNAYQAGSTIVSLLESKSDVVKLNAGKDILDRTIGKAGDTITLINDNKTLNIESVNVFLSRITERKTAPEAIPVDPAETLDKEE